MKTYCLVCKNYTDNSNSRVVKIKKINVKIKLFGVWKKKTRYGMLLDNYLVTPTDPSSII